MRQLWLLQLLLVTILTIDSTCAKVRRSHKKETTGHKKGHVKNPDVLKEFRSFADSVIPEGTWSDINSASKQRADIVSHQIAILVPSSGFEHSVEHKNIPLSLTRHFKNPVVYVDEPQRQVTRKVAFTNTGESTASEIGKTIYASGPSAQRDSTHSEYAEKAASSVAAKTKPRKGYKVATKNTNVIPEADTNKNGTDTANEDTEKPSEGLHNYKDDDEVDTYIDEKEEKSVKEKSTAPKKKKHPGRKMTSGITVLKDHRNSLKPLKHQMGGGVTKGGNRPTSAVATTSNNKNNEIKSNNNNAQVTNNNVPASNVQAMQKEARPAAPTKHPSISKMIQAITKEKGGEPPSLTELTKILKAAGISDDDLAEVEAGTPTNCEGVDCEGVKVEEDSPETPAAAAAVAAPVAPPQRPLPQQCIASCPGACAPECTPQCCTMETAPPPVKKTHNPPKVKEIRWYERPRYEPGPNVPPPIFPTEGQPEGCDASCVRSCTPKCPPLCCRKPKALRPVIGCPRQCTPNICAVGCPAHCCARYVRKSSVNPIITNLSI